MGRIKSTMVKRAAEQLMHQNAGFGPLFENNKKSLKGLMPSKSTRNKIAGYIARLVKAENLKAAQEAAKTAKVISS